jgi:hypothetical protein
MDVFAIIGAIGAVAGAINGLLELHKNAEAFLSDPDDDNRIRYEQTWDLIFWRSTQILDAAHEIMQAIDQLAATIFHQHISDKFGIADAAQEALDTWRRNQWQGQRDLALGDSAKALAQLLELWRNNVYPSISLVLPLIRILPVRLMILKELDPQFIRSQIIRKDIEDSIRMIRSAADWFEGRITGGNSIHQEVEKHLKEVRNRPKKEGGGREFIYASIIYYTYHNISRTVSCKSNSVEDETNPSVLAALREECSSARVAGLAEDLRRSQIGTLRDIADTVERMLLGQEIQIITKIFRRELTLVERARFSTLRRSSDFRQSTLGVVDRYLLERELPLLESETIREYGMELLNRELTDMEEQTLSSLSRSFGAKAVLRTLLNHGDCVINDLKGLSMN